MYFYFKIDKKTVADLHRSKRSSAWGPRTQGAPQFFLKMAAE